MMYPVMNVLIPKLKYAGEVLEGSAKFVRQLETLQVGDNNSYEYTILGCSSTRRVVQQYEEDTWECTPFRKIRDVRKLE